MTGSDSDTGLVRLHCLDCPSTLSTDDFDVVQILVHLPSYTIFPELLANSLPFVSP